MQNSTSKEILHNMIRREVHNLTVGIPMISVFENLIANYIISAVDPYINAFTGEDQQVNVNQLSSYAEYEVKNKIAKFKENFNKELGNNDGH